MAYCGKCGTQLSEGAKFCPKCGTAVTKNVTSVNKEQSNSLKRRYIKPFDKGDWLFLPFFIVILLAIIFFITLSYPNLHCKLFSWFPYFETPSVVAYKYINCAKKGNIEKMMEYAYMKDYPSIAKMKKNLAELNKSPNKKTPTTTEYFDSNNSYHSFTEEATKQDYIDLFSQFRLVKGENSDIQDFSIVSEEIKGSKASIRITYFLKSGLTETKTINLQKDEDGVWGFYINRGVKEALKYNLEKKEKRKKEEFDKKMKEQRNKKNDSSNTYYNNSNSRVKEYQEKTMRCVSQIQDIMRQINSIYNRYVSASISIDDIRKQSLGVNAIADISDLIIKGDNIFKEMIRLANEYGQQGNISTLRAEQEDFKKQGYQMSTNIRRDIYNENY